MCSIVCNRDTIIVIIQYYPRYFNSHHVAVFTINPLDYHYLINIKIKWNCQTYVCICEYKYKCRKYLKLKEKHIKQRLQWMTTKRPKEMHERVVMRNKKKKNKDTIL